MLDTKIARVKKLSETAKAHLDGASMAIRRYANILGIPEPKP